VSALVGDNVVDQSENTPWYSGPTLLDHLESVPISVPELHAPMRLPVQYVIRPRTPEFPDYRGYAGQVAAGSVRPGQEVLILPEGLRSTVAAVDTYDGQLAEAGVRRSVTVLLDDDIDVARGSMIVDAAQPPTVTDQLETTLCWLSDQPLRPGARLLLKHGTRVTQAIIGTLHDRLDTDTLTLSVPERLEINDIGRVDIRTADPLPIDNYADSRTTGSFLLIDPPTGNTLAAGLIGTPLVPEPEV
jgi:sulfate adenylyltransferase subunit 1